MAGKTRHRKKAYAGTSVTIGRTREEIDLILREWGVKGVQWEDDFESGCVTLRFRWKNDDGIEFVARYRLEMENDEQIRDEAIDKRNGKFSQAKYERLLKEQGKREHRLLLNFLKNVFEAVSEGIISAEAVFLPWLEAGDGLTIYERIKPAMNQLGSSSLTKALASSSDGDE